MRGAGVKRKPEHMYDISHTCSGGELVLRGSTELSDKNRTLFCVDWAFARFLKF